MGSFSDSLSRMLGKIDSLFESKESVPTLPRDVPVSELPAFMQPTIQQAHTKYLKGAGSIGGKPTIAYVPTGTTDAIYVGHPGYFDKNTQAHESTHIYQSTLRTPPKHEGKYEYGGWQGLIEDREKGKTIADFTDEQQASMIGDYTQLINFLNSEEFKKSDPVTQAIQLRNLDTANQALGPFIRQLAREPKKSDPTGSMFHPETLDLKSLNPPAPGPPPGELTGVGVPLPEYGGHSTFTPPLSKWDQAAKRILLGEGSPADYKMMDTPRPKGEK